MPTRVTLILEYDMGDYSDWEKDLAEEGEKLPTDPKSYEESFFQSDVFIHDMEIVGVRIERTE